MWYQSETPEGEEAEKRKGHMNMKLKGISKLPVEIIWICVDYMDPISASRFSRTCKGFTMALKDKLKEKTREFAQLQAIKWDWMHEKTYYPEAFAKRKHFQDGHKAVLPSSSPMLEAVEKGRVGALRGFLEAGLDPNLFSKDFSMPLLAMALYRDQLGTARLLLEYGADPCARLQGESTLEFALHEDSPRKYMIKGLLKAGAKIDSVRAFRLCCAKHLDTVDIFKFATKNGSDISRITDESTNSTILHELAGSKWPDCRVADYLLETWPELLNIQDNKGQIALHYALRLRTDHSMATYLLDRGIPLVGGELYVVLRDAYPKDDDHALIRRLLAHPNVDLHGDDYIRLRKSGEIISKPIRVAWSYTEFESVRLLLGHPSLRLDEEDIRFMETHMDTKNIVECHETLSMAISHWRGQGQTSYYDRGSQWPGDEF